MTHLFSIKTATDSGLTRRIGYAIKAETITEALDTLTKTAQVRPVLGVEVYDGHGFHAIPTANKLF